MKENDTPPTCTVHNTKMVWFQRESLGITGQFVCRACLLKDAEIIMQSVSPVPYQGKTENELVVWNKSIQSRAMKAMTLFKNPPPPKAKNSIFPVFAILVSIVIILWSLAYFSN